jgi:hypothetical protein
VPKRVSPCERLHAQIDEVFAGGADLAVALERVAQLGSPAVAAGGHRGRGGGVCGPGTLRTQRCVRARPSGNAQRALPDDD